MPFATKPKYYRFYRTPTADLRHFHSADIRRYRMQVAIRTFAPIHLIARRGSHGWDFGLNRRYEVNSPIFQDRIFCGVLCRRLLDNSFDESFRCLPDETQNFTKQKLLEWIVKDSQPQIRKKLLEIAVEIAKEQFGKRLPVT